MPSHADLNRRRAVSLSPWARGIVGDDAVVDLPDGYSITGLARSPRGPVSFGLHLAGVGMLAEQAATAEGAVAALHGLVDMAHVDARERRVVVTADAEGYIASIEGGAA